MSRNLPPDWPHAEASIFVEAGDVRWHVQRIPAAIGAPRVLFLHGTGASTHSFRDLMTLASCEFELVAVDLPGHAFSTPLPAERSDTTGFARALGALLQAIEVRPDVIVGHSAGVAVALRGFLLGALDEVPLLSINGAPVALGGLAGRWFAPAARMLAEREWIVSLCADRTRKRGAVASLLKETGTRFRSRDLMLYQRLLADRDHVAGVLRMMAAWDLPALEQGLGGVRAPVQLLVAPGDGTLPSNYAARVRRALPHAQERSLATAGHLSHEIDSEPVLQSLRALLAAHPPRGRAEPMLRLASDVQPQRPISIGSG